jgi:hypothetical protein
MAVAAVGGFLNAGLAEMALLITGTGTPDAWDAANAHIGVGDDDTAWAANQAGLLASTNKLLVPMVADYPSVTGAVMAWRGFFGEEQANYDWEEIVVENAASGGVPLFRAVANLGTKPGTQEWTLTATLTPVAVAAP